MPAKSGKPSNAELLAERKAIADLLVEFQGENNIAKLNAYMLEQKGVVEVLVAKNKLLADELSGYAIDRATPPMPPIPQQSWSPPAPVMAPLADAPEISHAPNSRVPLDTAYYPKQGEFVPPPQFTGPQMSAIHGDLTPSYVRWFLSTNGPDALRVKYGERVALLPEDVRRAIG